MVNTCAANCVRKVLSCKRSCDNRGCTVYSNCFNSMYTYVNLLCSNLITQLSVTGSSVSKAFQHFKWWKTRPGSKPSVIARVSYSGPRSKPIMYLYRTINIFISLWVLHIVWHHFRCYFSHSLWDFVQEREDRSSYLSEDDDDELSSLGLPFALRLAILDGSAESWSDVDLYDSD